MCFTLYLLESSDYLFFFKLATKRGVDLQLASYATMQNKHDTVKKDNEKEVKYQHNEFEK